MTDHTTNAVTDELAIRSLTAEYTDAINRGDVADAIATYAPDATFTMMDRPTVVGRDGIDDLRPLARRDRPTKLEPRHRIGAGNGESQSQQDG